MSYGQVVASPNLPSPYLVSGSDELWAEATAAFAVAVWPAANRAIFVPFSLPVNAHLSAMSCWCGTTNSANFDLGLYDAAGVRLGSLGSTALGVGINTWTLANPILLLAGTLYYAALAAVSASSTFGRTAQAVAAQRAVGIVQQASALPLPAPATFATPASIYVPLITLSFRGVPA